MKGLLGVLLSVKPVLTLKDGEVSPLTQVRTMKAGMDVLYNFAASHKQIDEMAVEYATTPDVADSLIVRLGSIYPKENIYRTTVSPVIGAYTGPSVICVSIIGKT